MKGRWVDRGDVRGMWADSGDVRKRWIEVWVEVCGHVEMDRGGRRIEVMLGRGGWIGEVRGWWADRGDVRRGGGRIKVM